MNETWTDRAIKFLRHWNEFLLIPIALVLWKLHVWYIVWFDPTAAPPDAGIFSFAIGAVIVSLFLRGFNWLVLRINFPDTFKYLTEEMETDLWLLDPRQRVLYGLVWYFLSLFAMILLYKTGF
jgi:hypothetical protein